MSTAVAKLPRATHDFPENAFGADTEEAIRVGVLLGIVAMVDGLVEKLREKLPGAKVIATGGDAELIAPRSRSIDRADPDLTLRGLAILFERNP